MGNHVVCCPNDLCCPCGLVCCPNDLRCPSGLVCCPNDLCCPSGLICGPSNHICSSSPTTYFINTAGAADRHGDTDAGSAKDRDGATKEHDDGPDYGDTDAGTASHSHDHTGASSEGMEGVSTERARVK